MKPSKPREPVEYWIEAATRQGRLRGQVRLWWKRAAWRTVLFLTHGLKRLLDIAVSATALLLGSPIYLLTALAIKMEDRGPIFFGQERVGYRGRLFRMWKFRSMVANAEALKKKLEQQNEMKGGVIFKMKADPRITRVGRFIRKYSIDELPQFWNVLRGDMSVVGPRPPVPKEVAQYSPEARQRLLAKPGITCIWQVSGRSDIDFDGQVKLDVEYIRSTSFWTDLVLLIRTVPAVLLGKGAY